MIGYYDELDFVRTNHSAPRRRPHYLLAALVFVAAYFTTVTVNAQVQPQADAIQLNSSKIASVVGTVVEADDNWVVIETAGKKMKITLDDVDMQGAADTVFSPGMQVTVDGRMKGDDFGVPIMKAESITATAPAQPVVVQ